MDEAEHRQRERVIEVMERNTDAAERLAAALEKIATAVTRGSGAHASVADDGAEAKGADVPAGGSTASPAKSAPAAPGGAPTIYARAVNAGAVDAPAAPAADVARCEPECGQGACMPTERPGVMCFHGEGGGAYCTEACRDAGRALHPRSATPETR